ncbi:MAG TPA: hypothetical protein VFV50_15965 [Bdellovibrionales bacterium]|nr:hypothetical protein [Bdellovibrionales bacterium]
MKTILMFLIISILFGAQNAYAVLPAEAVTSLKLYIHGIYTTSDAQCEKSLKATMPLRATPVETDFLQSPSLGAGKVPKSIRCVIIIAANKFEVAIAPGNYTSTTVDSSGVARSDSVCNAGKNITGGISMSSSTVTWIPEIKTAVEALGLTAPVGGTMNLDDVFPIYLSTDSKCEVNIYTDSQVPACWDAANNVSTSNPMAPPAGPESTTAGIKLEQPANKSSYQFYTDTSKFVGADRWGAGPDGIMGNGDDNVGCGDGVPKWGFR